MSWSVRPGPPASRSGDRLTVAASAVHDQAPRPRQWGWAFPALTRARRGSRAAGWAPQQPTSASRSGARQAVVGVGVADAAGVDVEELVVVHLTMHGRRVASMMPLLAELTST